MLKSLYRASAILCSTNINKDYIDDRKDIMNPNPHSFIICNISIEYPKRRLFDIFQQKKICIIESIEFILSENKYCYAIIYVASWDNGKLCIKFLEKLQEKKYVELVDCNNYVWKIVSTPIIIKQHPKWFQTQRKTCIHQENNNDREDVIVKIKSKPKPFFMKSSNEYEDDEDDHLHNDDNDTDDCNSDVSKYGDSESEDFEILFGK